LQREKVHEKGRTREKRSRGSGPKNITTQYLGSTVPRRTKEGKKPGVKWKTGKLATNTATSTSSKTKTRGRSPGQARV